MKIDGKVTRTGEDMRKAYDGLLKNDYEKNVPLSIFPEEDSQLAVEIIGRSFPYLSKTINSDGSIEIDEHYIFGMRVVPVSGRIGRIVLDDHFSIAHSGFSLTRDGLVAVFGDCRIEVFYEKTSGGIPDRTKYTMTTWDRRGDGNKFDSTILSPEEYENLKAEGIRINNERRARLDKVVSQALKEKNEQGPLSFLKKIRDYL